MSDSKRELLRHTVATVAYRGGKAIRNAPDHFGSFKIGESTKTPLEILAHIGDLFVWALSQAEGNEVWKDSESLEWNAEAERFFTAVGNFDSFLASDQPNQVSAEKLFQGPIADALTHVGQIAMLRRLADSPIRGENYFKANVKIGCVGDDQSDSLYEFD